MNKKAKVNDEEFLEIISKNDSVADCLLEMGLVRAGGNYSSFHRRAKSLSADTSHFSGQGWSKGKTIGPKKAINCYLQEDIYVSSCSLKRRLFKENLKDRVCESCKLTEWNGKLIPLELHHKDGSTTNNLLSNLEILCPNCHSQTDNYRGKNISKKSY